MWKNHICFVVIFISLIVFNTSVYAQCKGCKYFIHPDSLNVVGIEGSLLPNLLPGDTICLNAGKYFNLYIRNINGNQEKPIVIRNYNGEVIIENNSNFGITFAHCTNIKITGSGQTGLYYGIKINKVENGSGLSINYLSSNVEVERLEIANVAFSGIIAKTDPDCSFASLRDSFTLYNTYIHDNYVHDVGNEGMYIGSSFYHGYTLNCNGNDTTVLPHILSGVKVYNNRVEHTGWDAIQVGSASYDCQIYNNYVKDDSYAEIPDQMSGILIGGGSKCDCYNNIITDGKGDGLELLGLGDMKIFNNLIVNAGTSYYPNNPPSQYSKHGIYIKNIITLPNVGLYIYNNSIIHPKTHGIYFTNSETTGNEVYNNVITSPGILETSPSNAYLRIDIPMDQIDTSNNIYAPKEGNMLFDNVSSGNYDLQLGSPLINKGKDLSYAGINFDLLYRNRPFGIAYDVGAYECSKNGAGYPDLRRKERLEISPNPAHGKTDIIYCISKRQCITISLIDSFGNKIKDLISTVQDRGEYKFTIDISFLSSGIYYISLFDIHGIDTRKILIVN